MSATSTLERRSLRVRGAVQGVGFRPFVYRLARELSLAGNVRNDGAGVAIEVQGSLGAVEQFQQRLHLEAPVLARIDALESVASVARADEAEFTIEVSRKGEVVKTAIPADAAVCYACLEELFDLSDRRYRYALINCTDCGPRFTITRQLPYDRPSTSMAPFAMCDACESEYQNPLTRRFHAQPNACPQCGPDVYALNGTGERLAGVDPIAAVTQMLRAGQIVAIKGLGGFHLACDATNAEAVRRLRETKGRDEKPFAVMVASIASAQRWVEIDANAAALLTSRERPIVLLPKRETVDVQMNGVAPELAALGVMLPATPMQYLLFHEALGRPVGTAWLNERVDLTLLMTSANPGGEPLVIDNSEAIARLQPIADAYLLHDRDIVARCDDSVVRVTAIGRASPSNHRGSQLIRRARGFTPSPIKLRDDGPAVLALGAHLKNTICVSRENEAFLSAHVGDLDNAATCRALEEVVGHLTSILEARPQAIAHDLHPDFWSTRLAHRLAQEWGVPAIPVQHHHAHIAAIAAEHHVVEPVIGVALDGVGLGSDGTPWGGELLRVHGSRFERIGHFRPLSLPGGDRAAREPWRIAVAALHAIGELSEVEQRFGCAGLDLLQIIERKTYSPLTTSAGRWFDAAAGLLGVCERASYEGQAAMALEALASRAPATSAKCDDYVIDEQGVLDLLPVIAKLTRMQCVPEAAMMFHAAVISGVSAWALRGANRSGLRSVILGGGCFLNRIVSRGVRANLEVNGLHVFEAHQAPCNDGGLSLGQAAIARATLTTAEVL